MKYMNKRNEQIFEQVGEVDPKYKTVVLRNLETGHEQVITTNTFKRWYKKVGEEPTPETAEDQVQAVVDAEPTTEEPAVAVEEVVEKKPEKKVRAKREPKDFTELLQYIDEVAAEYNMVPYVREKQQYLRNYRINGEGPVMFLVYTRSRAVIQCKTKLLPETVYEQMKKANHCFDRQYDITNDRRFAKTVISSITVPTR